MGFFDRLFDSRAAQDAQLLNQDRPVDQDDENLLTVDPNTPLPECSKSLPPVFFENGGN